MELKVNEYQLPEQILFNYEELKAELTEKVQHYETLVYTDDQIKEAKADRATLNKLKKALSDERIRREREYMQPFNEFKSRINEIISIIDKPVAVIDKQIKEYEDTKKQEKLEEIKKLWSEMEAPDGMTLDKVFNDRMLNSSFNWSRKQMESHAVKYSPGYKRDLDKGTKYTFWSKDFDGMAYKTMLRQLISKWGIMSIELQNAIDSDMAIINEDGTKEYVENDDPVIDAEAQTVEAQSDSVQEAPVQQPTDAQAALFGNN